jgi:predicted nucleic acid-binding protein
MPSGRTTGLTTVRGWPARDRGAVQFGFSAARAGTAAIARADSATSQQYEDLIPCVYRGALRAWSAERAGKLNGVEAATGVLALADLPIERHALPALLLGSWTLRHRLRLVDGLYVELARQLGLRLITTDQRLARAAPIAETIG